MMYATIPEADQYLDFHMKKRIWVYFEDKTSALVSASRIIDNLPIKSVIDGIEITTRPLPIDQFAPESQRLIKEGCIEIALALADGIDPEMEYRQLTKTTQAYSVLRQQKNTEMMEPYIALGIPSFAAWTRLMRFIDLSRTVDLERVS